MLAGTSQQLPQEIDGSQIAHMHDTHAGTDKSPFSLNLNHLMRYGRIVKRMLRRTSPVGRNKRVII